MQYLHFLHRVGRFTACRCQLCPAHVPDSRKDGLTRRSTINSMRTASSLLFRSGICIYMHLIPCQSGSRVFSKTRPGKVIHHDQTIKGIVPVKTLWPV